MTLNFNSRASYIEWAANWKTEYVALSAKLRQKKLDVKRIQRDGAIIWVALRDLAALKAKAREMIDQRHESKELAQQQCLAARSCS